VAATRAIVPSARGLLAFAQGCVMSQWTIPLIVLGAMAAFLLMPLVIVVFALIMGSLGR
jgi:hypothetical protein